MNFLFYFLLGLFFLNCFVLSCLVLVQESRSMGLGASFGGDAGTSLFGTSTADILKKLTAAAGVVFALLCFVLSIWTSVSQNPSYVQSPQVEQHS
jgi:preprotein translocase subunit SecG